MLRQILGVVNKGDSLELGLQIVSQAPSAASRRISTPNVHHDLEGYRRRNSSQTSLDDQSGPFMCVFEIIHNVAQHVDSNAATPKAELNPFTRLAEQKEAATPNLDTPLTNRLLRQVNAWLKTDAVLTSPSSFGLPRHAYELYVVLNRGLPILEPAPLSAEEEAIRQPFSGLMLPREPTLADLAEFAETLRGKKVNLHASLTSIFARHLTSYLAAYGLDVSHVPIEEDTVPQHQPAVSDGSTQPKFIIIDEDVESLKRELGKLRPESAPVLHRQRSVKRPNLFRNARSTMSVRQAQGPIIIHFTSLNKYHQVRDVIATLGALAPPEVMVVPKPVGPRRLLTALFTAVRQTAVDPAFSPIATSPRSPQIASGNRTPTGVSQEGFFDAVDTLHAEPTVYKARSPLAEHPPALSTQQRTSSDPLRFPASSTDDLVTTPASEYFSRASTTRQPTSGASGVVLQSPDGRPVGMFFEPPSTTNLAAFSHRPDNARRPPTNRQPTGETDRSSIKTPPTESPNSSRRASATSATSEVVEEPLQTSAAPSVAEPVAPVAVRRKTLPIPPDAKPLVAQGRDRSSTVTRRHTAMSDPSADRALTGITESKSGSRAAKASDVVIPPINVLIVEGERKICDAKAYSKITRSTRTFWPCFSSARRSNIKLQRTARRRSRSGAQGVSISSWYVAPSSPVTGLLMV